MTRAADLASLFKTSPGTGLGAAQPVSFLTGKVTFWNPLTGGNAIDVAGTIFENLPLLNRSEIPAIVSGDTVALLVVGGTSKTVAIIGGIVATA